MHVRPCQRSAGLASAAGLLVLACAALFWLDASLTTWIHDIGLDDLLRRHPRFTIAPRVLGHFAFAAAAALTLTLLHPLRAQAGAILLGACFCAGIACWFMKWATGRPRPDHLRGMAAMTFHPFPQGLSGLLSQRAVSMPSGDTALAFALAAALAWALPRGGWWFFAGASLVGIGRVLFNAHHLSDVLAGAAVGILSFHLGHFAGGFLGGRAATRHGVEPTLGQC
jgi:membrane-associated phospholipid phosphatase